MSEIEIWSVPELQQKLDEVLRNEERRLKT
jgi:hypothetical protein